MNLLIQLFEIIFLRREAKDLKHDSTDLGLAVLAYAGATYLQVLFMVRAYPEQTVVSNPILFSALQAVLMLAVFSWIMRLNKRGERLVQTATASFGVAAILLVVSFLAASNSATAIIGLVATVWNLVLWVRILKSALENSILGSLFLVFVIQFLTMIPLMFIFPEYVEFYMSQFAPSEQA